jgi:hypothetical protein
MANRTHAFSHCLALPSWVCRAYQLTQDKLRSKSKQSLDKELNVSMWLLYIDGSYLLFDSKMDDFEIIWPKNTHSVVILRTKTRLEH